MTTVSVDRIRVKGQGAPVFQQAYRFSDQGHGAFRLVAGGLRRLVSTYHQSLDDPEGAQRARLDALLDQVRDTAFGRDHGLRRGLTLQQFRDQVPLRGHDDLLPWLTRMQAGEANVLTRAPVRSLLKTSGTTGASKLLPVTEAYARTVDQGQELWRLALIRDHEGVTQGRALTVVSPASEAKLPSGLRYGSNTGRMQSRQPWYIKWRIPVPPQVAAIQDADARVYTLLRFALQHKISTITTANPSTLLLLCRKLQEHRAALTRDLRSGGLSGPASSLSRRTRLALRARLRRTPVPTQWTPAAIWDLATVNCWKGGPAQFFIDRLEGALGGPVPVREVGLTASEGYFAVPMSDGDEGGVAWLGGHLLEFMDDTETARWAWELQVGQRYRLVISTLAGLYRYDMQDVVECTGHVGRAPLLKFVRKAGNVLSVTGEKLTEDQIVAGMRVALAGASVTGFTVGHRMAEIPRLRVMVEGAVPSGLAGALDAALQDGNIEYAAKRDSGRLGLPEVESVPAGTYLRYRNQRVAEGAPDGQVKDPLVAVDSAAWARLERASVDRG
jgi:hypothetical protein